MRVGRCKLEVQIFQHHGRSGDIVNCSVLGVSRCRRNGDQTQGRDSGLQVNCESNLQPQSAESDPSVLSCLQKLIVTASPPSPPHHTFQRPARPSPSQPHSRSPPSLSKLSVSRDPSAPTHNHPPAAAPAARCIYSGVHPASSTLYACLLGSS